MNIELRSVRFFQADEKWVLANRTVTGLAAEVVFRVHEEARTPKDFVVDVPPIELREALTNTAETSGEGLDTNLIALALALGSLESRIAEAGATDSLPSLLVVQPNNVGGLYVPEELLKRAAALLKWTTIPGEAHASSR